MPINFKGIERISHDQDKLREARFWSPRSIAERVIAGWALRDNNLMAREDHEPEKRTAPTLRRIARSWR
jgi:hypothetical protein